MLSFNKTIIIFFVFYSTVALGQQQNSNSWDEVVADINNHKGHIEGITIIHTENYEEHIDSLMIVNTENFEDISLELYTTDLELGPGDELNEKMYVITQNYAISTWNGVEVTDYGIIVTLNEKTQTSETNRKLTWVVDSKEIRRLLYDAFEYLIDTKNLIRKRKAMLIPVIIKLV